jgi:hypothetical protein
MSFFAHETWFTDLTPSDWSFAFEAATLALLGLALVVTLLVRLLAQLFPGVDVPFLARLAPWMPFAVRLHLAVSLVGLLSLGYHLSPAMDLAADPAGIALGAVMAAVAISMAAGWHARAGALLLVAAGPLGVLEWFFGNTELVGHLPIYGAMLVLLVYGSDPQLRPAASALWPWDRPRLGPARLPAASRT